MRRHTHGPAKATQEKELKVADAPYVPVALVFFRRTRKLSHGVSERQILLGEKKSGFGLGKYVGIGGHAEPGETFRQAAVREAEEEILVTPAKLEYKGWADFIFPALPKHNMTSALYTCDEWQGAMEETEEIKPRWFACGHLPYHKMWQDCQAWLPRIVHGEKIHATIVMDDDNERTKTTSIISL